MYLIVIAWIYVVLMMSVAEATNTTGTLLGAIITFVLYGLGPVALVVYLMRTPARRRAIKAREAAEAAAAQSASHPPDSGQPDTSRHAAGGVETVAVDTGVASVRKEP
ncbi:hypothetical protein [Polaromonas sp. SM01]|uniref:hypothetical protein n=1 Tax=Polaromonas sp. SM01 TaxID=3085630 RepID=UPI0029826DA2|nr:hypothetical protein [Polaromonas sp. SM01]MDW5443066.1 hypothetical protein [Polaromonas sp. SM01]